MTLIWHGNDLIRLSCLFRIILTFPPLEMRRKLFNLGSINETKNDGWHGKNTMARFSGFGGTKKIWRHVFETY